MSWESLYTYKGPNWEDYLSSEPLNLQQGSYLSQFAKVLLYARSVGNLTTGYRFVLPLKIDNPYNTSNPTDFNPLPQFEGSDALLPGGEYKLGASFIMHWESDNQFARQKFIVRPFDINSLTNRSQFFQWYKNTMQSIPGGGYVFDTITGLLSNYVYSRLGYWQPSPADIMMSSAAGGTAGGLLDSIGYTENNTSTTTKKRSIAPWILAAIAASQIIG